VSGLEDYERVVNTDLAKLTLDMLGKMLSSTEAFGVEHVSHHILLVSPQSNCAEQSIAIPSRYMYNKLRDQLQVHTLQGATRLHQILMRNTYAKTPAEYILDDVHDLFCKGGEWRITPMTKNSIGRVNTHFKSPSPAKKSSYMRLDHGGEQLAIAPRSLSEGAEFNPLAHHQFVLDQSIHLEDGYYQPLVSRPSIVLSMIKVPKQQLCFR
jgi:hypothetical protein